MRYFLVLVAFVFVACQSSSDSTTNETLTSVENLQNDIDALFQSKIDQNGPGAALLVAYDGEMLIGNGYGLRDLESGEPITPTTNMRMASVSKQFTALAVLSLVEKGLIALTDTVSKYLPYEVFDKITVEQLTNHTSGIANYDPYFFGVFDRTKIAENKDVLAWYATHPKPEFPPGTKWEYSNGAYNLLATLVETVSGQDFAEYAEEMLFERAGMSETHYFNLARPIEISERAFCYEDDKMGGWEKVDGHFLNGLIGEGSIYTSVNDYFQYDKALRNKAILSGSAHAMIEQPNDSAIPGEKNYIQLDFLGESKVKYSMGWFVNDDFAFHTGSWNGTRTIVVRERKRPLTFAIFMNSNDSVSRKELMEKTYQLVNEYVLKKN